nr:hypothetical protein [Candidatus Sigynarchaeota archaeon]
MSLDDWTNPKSGAKKEKKEKTSDPNTAKSKKKSPAKTERREKKKEEGEFEAAGEVSGNSQDEIGGPQGENAGAGDVAENGPETRAPGESSLKLVGLATFVLSCPKCKVKRTVKTATLRAGHTICKKCGGDMKVKQ